MKTYIDYLKSDLLVTIGITAALYVAASVFAPSAKADVFPVPIDDAAHLLGTFAIASTAAPLLAGTDHPVLYPFLISYASGTAKEISDMRKTGNPLDKHDMAVNAVGAAVGAIVGNQVYLFAVSKGFGIGVKGTFATGKAEGEK